MEGILKPLVRQIVRFRISLFADDALIFINPNFMDVKATAELLMLFGQATGLDTNPAKSSIIPICCDNIDLTRILQPLTCPVKTFSCTYLGLPLSNTIVLYTSVRVLCFTGD